MAILQYVFEIFFSYDHSDQCCPDPSVNAQKLRANAALFGVVIPVPDSYSVPEMVEIAGMSNRVYNWTTTDLIPAVNDIISTCKQTTYSKL